MKPYLHLPCLLLLATLAEGAELQLARPFDDHMVLPMARPLPVWGTAAVGTEIEVRFGDQSARATANGDGHWTVTLPAMPASAENRTFEVSSGGETITLGDVLVGQVWLCSGQSNMDFPLSRATGGGEEAAAAGQFDAIRLCNLSGAPTDGRAYDEAARGRLTTSEHFQGSWQKNGCAGEISAIAWWTARIVHEKTGVPIGIVENAVGGSGAEAWLAIETLNSRPGYRELLDESWLESEKISAWARGRARQNLGDDTRGNHPFRPGFLFESGVRPWARFPFHAVLWYQGETNAEIPDMDWNETMIRDLVTGWRKAMGQESLPFYMVQLPRIGGNDPLRQHWPEFRKAQSRAAEALPDAHLIVTEDLGWDSPDVHPPDKLPVAERIAEAILRDAAEKPR